MRPRLNEIPNPDKLYEVVSTRYINCRLEERPVRAIRKSNLEAFCEYLNDCGFVSTNREIILDVGDEIEYVTFQRTLVDRMKNGEQNECKETITIKPYVGPKIMEYGYEFKDVATEPSMDLEEVEPGYFESRQKSFSELSEFDDDEDDEEDEEYDYYSGKSIWWPDENDWDYNFA